MRQLAIACLGLAPALAAAKTAVATFDMAGVTGTVTFSQDTADDPTDIAVDLAGLADLPNKWHAHMFPVGAGCGYSSTGGHYNPYDVDSSACAEDTPEGCEVGDLSGRFGTFATAAVAETVEHDEMTLFGEESVVGRSVVLHADSDGSRYACATIELDVADVVTVVAYFDSPVAGTVTLTQDAADPDSDTTVVADLWWVSGQSTADHKWHVHEDRVPLGGTCTDTNDHYNPLDVSGDECVEGVEDDSLCEIADLTIKDGPLSLPSAGDSKGFWTDTNLPLSGANSVAGRSIVIHEQDGGSDRVACASLGKTAVATFASGRGTVEFFQPTADADTEISVDVSGLEDTPNSYHIHLFPVPADGDCSNDATGYHHLTDAGGDGTGCTEGTPELCETGDLSGKYGTLDAAAVETAYSDEFITLHGPDSSLGRSVVLHTSDGARYDCATIQRIESEVTVEAPFSSGALEGSITMTQFAHDPLSDATVLIDLAYADADDDASATADHKWHVHEDQLSSPGACDDGDAGPHFNPFEVSNDACVDTDSDVAACGVGETATKHGNIPLPSTGPDKLFFTDGRLPLSGDFSVEDLSFVVHAADDSTDYLTCANLALADTLGGGGGDDEGSDAVAIALGVTIPAVVIIGALYYIGAKELRRRAAVEELRKVKEGKTTEMSAARGVV